MSSILKALKKLERDKALRRPDTYRIDADILRSAPPRRSSSTAVVAAAVAMFACGVAATYFFMQPSKPPAAEKTAQAPIDGAAAAPVGTQRAVPVDTHPAGQPLDRTTGARLLRPDQETAAAGKTLSPPRPVDRLPQPRRTEPAGIVPRTEPLDPKTVPPAVAPVPLAAPVKPVLKVHGIAFQDGADSMAVINGITASKGSVIEGVRVEEILKDRVRFSWSGEKFEIILDKSN